MEYVMNQTDRNKIHAELMDVILNYLREQKIDPSNSTQVIMAAPQIWKALCESGKMPKFLTYSMMMEGMMSASLSKQFGNMFGRRN